MRCVAAAGGSSCGAMGTEGTSQFENRFEGASPESALGISSVLHAIDFVRDYVHRIRIAVHISSLRGSGRLPVAARGASCIAQRVQSAGKDLVAALLLFKRVAKEISQQRALLT